ncbi:MAG TPA: zf-HC2 domain-containing protein, partial [Candidatus Limnocylindria bacterium]|nr:zf-HC2 domain-containing protein [Candidatus Limnocylindria bacterium]
MRCRKVRRSLLAALDGELAPAEREVVRAHVAACAACRAIEAEAVRLHRALADLPQAASLPAGLAEATMRRVRAEAA